MPPPQESTCYGDPSKDCPSAVRAVVHVVSQVIEVGETGPEIVQEFMK
jgi:hypothetical protein